MSNLFKIIFFLFLTNPSINDAQLEVESYMSELERSFSDSTQHFSQSVLYFERLTGILSNSELFDGIPISPTRDDFNNWILWYNKNKKIVNRDYLNEKVYISDTIVISTDTIVRTIDSVGTFYINISK